MTNCLTCGKELIHTVGRKEKMYCDQTCRSRDYKKKASKYVLRKTYDALLEENSSLKNEIAILMRNKPADLPNDVKSHPADFSEALPPKKEPKSKIQNLTDDQTTNRVIDTKPTEDFDKAATERRVKEIETELKSPPKSPQIGIKAWTLIRQTEINNLKKLL